MSSTTTSRLGLIKPTPGSGEPVNVATQLNDSWDKIDAAIGATVCTSSTRPASPYPGQIIYETDTGRVYVRSASSTWVQVSTSLSPVLPAEAGATGFTSTSTNTSATYINIAGAPTVSFTKVSASTKIRVDMKFTCFSDTVGNTGVQLGARINSSDYDIVKHQFTGAVEYETFGSFSYISGIPAGTYTIQPRWRRLTGSGVLTASSSFSELDISARETQ